LSTSESRVIREARADDVAVLARLHRACLPASMLTRLGSLIVTRYYRFAIGSPLEHVWVALDDAGSGGDGARTVVGGCVLSDEPGTVSQRFFLGRRFVRRPAHSPEVTQIFTDGKLRGKGLGAALLRACEATLRTRGLRKYFVHTQRDDNDAGIRFYRREGFVPIGESRSFGEAFLVMQKELD
jgi:ribosomal protein S18 acetylase RimI-like enzyme